MTKNLTKGTLTTASGPIIMSNPPHPQSQLASETVSAKNLDELKKLYNEHGLAVKNGTAADVIDYPAKTQDLKEGQVSDLARSARSFLNDDTELTGETKDLISKLHGTVNIQTYAVEDIVVTPANPWVISGSGPVVVNVNKVTVEPGGQIQVLTDASITIAELIKQ